MIPRFGRPPRPDQTYRLRPGAYALLLRQGRALLTRQIGPDEDVQLPGGGIDPGEGAIAALHREVREETGWAIAGPRRIGAFRRFDYLPNYGFFAEKLCHVWLARPVIRRGAPTEPDHRALWVDMADLPDAVTEPGARGFLRAWLARRR